MPTRMAMDKLRRNLLAMGEMCEYALVSAIMALVDRDQDLAYYVINYDDEIDQMELTVDRICTDLIIGGGLAGSDFRLVTAALKINNDLERIGDLASGICEHVLFLVRERTVLSQVIDFHAMLELVNAMMRESIQALLNHDVSLAWRIIDERQIVDEEGQIIFREVLDIIQRDPRTAERCCHVLAIQQILQRVADQASNIAEEVIFMEEGVVVRHNIREFHAVEPCPYGDLDQGGIETEEAKLAATRKSREQVRREHARAKRKTRHISREELARAAPRARDKAAKARENLIRQRSRLRNHGA